MGHKQTLFQAAARKKVLRGALPEPKSEATRGVRECS